MNSWRGGNVNKGNQNGAPRGKWELPVLTLLVCANAGLWIVLQVHHYTTLPVSLGVNRQLIG